MDCKNRPLDESADMTSAIAEQANVGNAGKQGVEISFRFPRIPCTKYNVIGNSKMRVRREQRHRDHKESVWKVPKAVQANLDAKVSEVPHADRTNGLAKGAVYGKRRRPFRQQESLNSHDKSSLYAARSEDSFKDFEINHTPRMVTLVDERFKTEKRYIARFYRQRSSVLLSPIHKKRPSRTVSISLPSVVQEYDLTDPGKGDRPGPAKEKPISMIQLDKYHSKDCLYCDVAGQKYCSECRRKHRHIRIAESSPDSLKFPKLPSCHVQKHNHGAPSTEPINDNEGQQAGRMQGHRYRERRASPVLDEPPAHFKGYAKGNGRKQKTKYTILPRIDLPKITNDTDTRRF
nr:uncharacterized protein LOC129282510 [Lytechinus pictus]